MFLYKKNFFSISSILSIPIMLIGINGGYFPAICRVCLFDILDRIFVLNGFFNPFIVHSRHSFLFERNFSLSLVVFVRMWHFDMDFLFSVLFTCFVF